MSEDKDPTAFGWWWSLALFIVEVGDWAAA